MLAIHWLSFRRQRSASRPISHEEQFDLIKTNLLEAASKANTIGDPGAVNPESVEQLLSLLEVVRSELGKIDSAASLLTSRSKVAPTKSKLHQFKKQAPRNLESTAFTVARRLLARGESEEIVAKKTLLTLDAVKLLAGKKTNQETPPSEDVSIHVEREETLL